MARGQWQTLLGGMTFGVIWMCCSAVMPAVIGKAIDAGVAGKDQSALVKWAAVLLGIGILGAVSGILRHRFAVTNWLTAAYRTVQLVARHATHLGATLSKKVATGEVVAIGTNDLAYVGNLMDVSARAVGAVVSFVVVSLILLHTSATLGLVVLLGVPLLLLAIGPLLKPLQRRNLEQREMMGHLSNLATDIVSGLRVLRGIGGERVFHARYATESQRVRRAGVRVAALQSVLDALQVLLPGIFVVFVHRDRAGCPRFGQVQLQLGAEHQDGGPAVGEDGAARVREARVHQTELGSRHELDADLHAASGAPHPPQEYTRGGAAQLVPLFVRTQRHRVADDQPPLLIRGRPDRVQHQAGGTVAPGRGESGRRGRDQEVTGGIVQQPTEDRRAVEAGEAQPVHGASRRDQRCRPAVGQQGVVSQRNVAHEPIEPHRPQRRAPAG